MKLGKKGFSLWQIPTVVITLAVIAIILSVSSTVIQDVRDDAKTSPGMDASNGTYAYNASHKGLVGLDTVAGWQDNIGTVVGAAVILTIILGTLAFVGMRRT